MNYKGYEFKWELNKNDKQFIDYLIENNFKITKHKQYISKTKYVLEKDNVEFEYEIVSEIINMKSYLKIFDRAFETHKEYLKLIKKQ